MWLCKPKILIFLVTIAFCFNQWLLRGLWISISSDQQQESADEWTLRVLSEFRQRGYTIRRGSQSFDNLQDLCSPIINQIMDLDKLDSQDPNKEEANSNNPPPVKQAGDSQDVAFLKAQLAFMKKELDAKNSSPELSKTQELLKTAVRKLNETKLELQEVISNGVKDRVAIKKLYQKGQIPHYLKEEHHDQWTFSDHHTLLLWQERSNISMTERHQVLIKLLDVLCKYLDKHRISYWITHGTLLGSWRDKSIIPWDEDADLGILPADFKRLEEIVANSTFEDCPQCMLLFRTGKDSEVLPAKFLDRETGIYVDFLLFQRSGGFIEIKWGGKKKIANDLMFPLQRCPLDNLQLLCPASPEKVLKKFYGANLGPKPPKGWTQTPSKSKAT